MRVILEMKVLLVCIKEDLCQCQHPCTMQVRSHRVVIHNALVHIMYLHVMEPCLKVIIAVFFFPIRKVLRKTFSGEMGNIRCSRVVEMEKVIKTSLLG